MTTLPKCYGHRVLAMTVMLVVASTMLWGCGKKEASVETPAPQTVNAAASPAPGTAPAAAPQTTILEAKSIPPPPGPDGGPP